ncbi:hypothetical protein SAZ11_07860 [Streptomyces sp. FXJ1.4098]|nr:hypothetical protein [Streptomyces sp. FXJ1.4098]
MQPEPTVLLACLAVAALGILCLAVGVGRKRRWRDPTRLYSWSQKQQLIRRCIAAPDPQTGGQVPSPGPTTAQLHEIAKLLVDVEVSLPLDVPADVADARADRQSKRGSKSRCLPVPAVRHPPSAGR